MGATDESDVEKAAARMEQEADDLQHRTERLGEHIENTRQEWHGKRGDASAPGAVPEERARDAESESDAEDTAA